MECGKGCRKVRAQHDEGAAAAEAAMEGKERMRCKSVVRRQGASKGQERIRFPVIEAGEGAIKVG